MAKAKITLTGALSMSKGRYRFLRNQTQISDDEALIKECEIDGQFAVSRIEEPKTAAKPTKDKDGKKDGKKDEESDAPPPAGGKDSKAPPAK